MASLCPLPLPLPAPASPPAAPLQPHPTKFAYAASSAAREYNCDLAARAEPGQAVVAGAGRAIIATIKGQLCWAFEGFVRVVDERGKWGEAHGRGTAVCCA